MAVNERYIIKQMVARAHWKLWERVQMGNSESPYSRERELSIYTPSSLRHCLGLLEV